MKNGFNTATALSQEHVLIKSLFIIPFYKKITAFMTKKDVGHMLYVFSNHLIMFQHLRFVVKQVLLEVYYLHKVRQPHVLPLHQSGELRDYTQF